MYKQCLQHRHYAAIRVEHDRPGCIEHFKVDVITGAINIVGIPEHHVTQITE
ncbi:MAG: hypothetical protein QNL87_01425 [Gammaproteobacteria bacterium]|nr:hypothetical protein [Gammaproteobacteria bacterium]